MAKTDFKTVDEYIATFPEDVQEILENIRMAIRKVVPDAEEVISYKMPAFKYHGMLMWYAAWKKHIGLYPRTEAMETTFKKELAEYEGSKGTIKFPLNKPMPFDLIGRLALYRAIENLEKSKKETI